MEKEEKRLREEIRCFFEEVETADQEEDARYGTKQVEELQDHLKKEESATRNSSYGSERACISRNRPRS